MAMGEWISVQSARELQEREIATEADELATRPEEEMEELALIYQAKGFPREQAHAISRQVMGNSGSALDTLVKEGLSIQRKTQSVAEEKITEATQKMATLADDISSKASGQWDKLETIFEDRVAKALNKLGVPSSRDIDVLVARIDELNKSVAKLSGAKAPAAPKAAAKTAAKPAAKRAAAKRAA